MTQSVAERVLKDRQQLRDAAEQALFQTAEDDEVSYEAWDIFQALGWDQATINSERRRARRVIAAMAEAGSDSDLAKAKKAQDQARQRFEMGGPKLHQQIAALQQQLSALEHDVDTTTAAVRQYEDARETLRRPELLPKHVLQDYDRQRAWVSDEYRKPLQAVEGAIRRIEALTSIRWGDPQFRPAIEGVLNRMDVADRPTSVTEWDKWVAEQRKPLAGLEKERKQLAKVYEERLADVQVMRDHYVKRLG